MEKVNLTRNTIIAVLASLLYMVIMYFIGFNTPRENFTQFILLYLCAFTIFYGLWLNKQQWRFRHFLALAVLLRLVLLFAAPELSNDFYRFIWDGEMMSRGINPYAHIPNDLISQGPIYNEQYLRMLYHGMGELSQANYSCYPVFNQLLFYVPASVSNDIQLNVIILKCILILADIGAIIVGKRILERLKKPIHLIWLYGLNPFIILEFSGNVHFEGVMIFFLLLAIYYLMLDKWVLAGIFFAIAIQVKLIPLILIPFVFKKLRWRRSLGFTAMTAAVVLIFGALLLNETFLGNMMQSIELYFTSFQFNGSISTVLKEVTRSSNGWDGIRFYGPLLSKIAIVSIGLLAVLKAFENDTHVFGGMLFALVIYYAFATTVHPWYISTILALSVFTRYKFALIWSLLVMLSYYAYSNEGFLENQLYIFVEYILVFGIMIFEIIRYTAKSDFALQWSRFFSEGTHE